MKKMIIAGAGQMGMSVSQLLNETNISLRRLQTTVRISGETVIFPLFPLPMPLL